MLSFSILLVKDIIRDRLTLLLNSGVVVIDAQVERTFNDVPSESLDCLDILGIVIKIGGEGFGESIWARRQPKTLAFSISDSTFKAFSRYFHSFCWAVQMVC